MNGGQSSQFGHSSPHHGLPVDCYSKKLETATQAMYQMPPFDSLNRMDTELQFMVPPSSITTTTAGSSNCNLASSMSTQQSSPPWAGSSYPTTFDSPLSTEDYYDYATPSPGIEDARGYMSYAKIPRSCPHYDSNILNEENMTLQRYGHSNYVMGSNKYLAQRLQGPSSVEYATQQSSRDFERLSISPLKMEQDVLDFEGVPYYDGGGTCSKIPSSDPSEDGASVREPMDPDDPTADEPYAKLIYKALLSAPNHSMVLQDIYQWFRENTAKGSPDSKGWMNSIRHNLSMNAAFEKTERKMAGDDSKKSTEWVLADFAIRVGVQSTTRYRKGTGAKKFIRSNNPAPARQSSGRKGGICSSKTKLHRQRAGRMEQMEPGLSSSYHHGIDPARRLEFQQHTNARMMDDRARTPLTPPTASALPDSYYFGKSESSYDLLTDNVYKLENVSGIYLDEAPVFGNADVYDTAIDSPVGFLMHGNQHL